MSAKRKILFAIIACAVVAGGAAVAHHKLGPYHFKTVKTGVLYRSGSLEPHHLESMVQRYGIKTIVSLRLPDEGGWMPDWYQVETDLATAKGIRFVNFPIRGKNPPSDDQVKQWLEIMGDPASRPVLVHCAQGVIRTGVMVALYEIAIEGKSNRQAWDQLPDFGHDFTTDAMLKLRDFVLNFNAAAYREPATVAPAPALQPEKTAH